MKVQASADFGSLKDLVASLRRASAVLLFTATNRGVEQVKSQAPGGAQGRIGKGVTKEFDHTARPPEGHVIAEAMVGRRAGGATLHLPGGGTKQITLRGSAAVNVAELVATGTGLRGPRRQMIVPRRARVLLIESDDAGAGEAYVEQGGHRFVLRPRSRGLRPDDYPGRAAETLEFEIDGLADRALAQTGVL